MSNKQKQESENIEALQRLMQTWILKMTTAAGSGHPTSSLSALHAMSVLFFGRAQDGSAFFHYDSAAPACTKNDRLIFSKGHASPLYYALWAAAGVVHQEELMTFRQFDSVLEGHPTRRFPLTEVPTGSLGQGLSTGIGEALALRACGSAARTFVLLGDSEMAEGQVWEAMAVATYYKLDTVIAIVDVNRLGQRGETMLGHNIEAYKRRAEAFGWHAIVIDGHDNDTLVHAYTEALQVRGRPVMIIARTRKGYGVSFLEDKDGWHGKVLNEEMLTRALEEIGPVDTSVRGEIALPDATCTESDIGTHDGIYSNLTSPYAVGESVAPRVAYGDALAAMCEVYRTVVALDAETSNSTKAEKVKEKTPQQFYEMFIAEQNMVSVAVGMARRGLRPFVSSFAAFLTRATDQIRMAQYAGVDVVFVGSHCGVSIGPDGASQMGLEDLALFGALRESTILYPADAVSTYALTACARACKGITYVRTTREALPVIYDKDEVFTVGGSKVVRQTERDVALVVAAGITVHEALRAADNLAQKGINITVLDCYSIRPLDTETVRALAQRTERVIVVEDHHENGGLGSAVCRALAGSAISIEHLCVRKPPRSGRSAQLLTYEEIDAEAITYVVENGIVER